MTTREQIREQIRQAVQDAWDDHGTRGTWGEFKSDVAQRVLGLPGLLVKAEDQSPRALDSRVRGTGTTVSETRLG